MLKKIDGDLYFSVTLPDVPIATFGGGTRLETAKECLDIMGVYGAGKVGKFAEIIAGTVLAGELSLIGALAAGHLARAHKNWVEDDLFPVILKLIFFLLANRVKNLGINLLYKREITIILGEFFIMKLTEFI